MTVEQKQTVVRKTIQHNESVVRWWTNHRPLPALVRLKELLVPPPPSCRPLGTRAPPNVCESARIVARATRTLERLRGTLPETGDWLTAVRAVQVAFPGSESWLVACSSSEGGHGAPVWNGGYPLSRYPSKPSGSSGALGNMQYMEGTFWTDFNAAAADLRARGFTLPRSAWSWSSPLGQAAAGGWAYFHARPSGKWTGWRC